VLPSGRSGGVNHGRFDERAASPHRKAQERDRRNRSGDRSLVTQGERGLRQPRSCHRCVDPTYDRGQGGTDPFSVALLDRAEQRVDIERHDRRQELKRSVSAGQLDHFVNELAELVGRAAEKVTLTRGL
jgi:hypothetical protein